MASAKLGRLLSIVSLLQSKEWIPAQKIADQFNVSLRTVYRDIKSLQENGFLVRGVPGPEGGYQLEAEDPFPKVIFGSENALSLYLLGASTHNLPPVLRGKREQTLARLVQEVRPEVADLLQRAASRIYFDTQEWYWREEGVALLPQVREAVFQQYVIEVDYLDKHTSAVTRMRLKPYGLVWKGGQWYVVGQETDRPIRRYRLGQIRNLRNTEESFEYLAEFSLVAWWKEDLERYGTGGVRVRLRVRPDAQGEFQQLNTKQDSQLEVDGEDQIYTLFVDRWEWLVPIVMNYGKSVYVEEPKELQNRVIGELGQSLDQYDGEVTSRKQSWNRLDDSRSRSTRGREAL